MHKYDANRVYEIEMNRIFADVEFNCRGVIDPTSVIELANDIKHKGLTEPIILQPYEHDGKEFRIVAGYRRFMAHQILGKDKAPTIRSLIKEDLTDLDARLLNLSENLHRENLNIKQEAHAIDHFRRAGWTEIEVATKIQKSRGWVQIRFMLLELPDIIQDEAAAGFLSQQQIRDVWSLQSVEQQIEYVKLAKDKKILGRKREVKVSQVKVHNERRIRTEQEMQDMQDLIREKVGNNELTKLLGWCFGVNSDLEWHKYLAEYFRSKGKFYVIPEGLEGLRATQVRETKAEAMKA